MSEIILTSEANVEPIKPTVDCAGWVELRYEPGHYEAAEFDVLTQTYYLTRGEAYSHAEILNYRMMPKPTMEDGS